MVAVIALAAIFAPYITRYNPTEQLIWTEGSKVQLVPPCSRFWFGTDIYGRDVFSRVVYGARTSLLIGIASTAISLVIGITLGALAGYYGGVVDDIVSWLANVFLPFHSSCLYWPWWPTCLRGCP